MKKASDRILKRSVLSVLVAATLHIPQTMAEFTETVTAGLIVRDETVENGTQTVWKGGKTEDITIEQGGVQYVNGGGSATGTTINDGGEQVVYGTAKDTTINGGIQYVNGGGSATGTTINDGGEQTVYFGGSATNTTIYQGGEQYVSSEGSATGTTIYQGGGQYVYSGGSATGTTIYQGGGQYVSSGGSATGTTINGGIQYVSSEGSATNTAINAGGLMQNAGEDTGTTVKSGGVYELGRIVYGGRNDYFGTSSASDLTVDAGGRATVYAGTLTGATVSGEDATLTLMTPQTETKDSDFTLSLTGNVSVTDHARLVAQRGADMSGADLTLGSQGTLILKGDTGCPEEGCSWTVKSLTLDNGEVAFYDTAAVSDGGYQSL
ncbi:AIDA repeat-containing protein, partial [Escherichia coli]|nr:AIDA repeat-containing protein [Escherichia coli]